jgi:hypothetical protein
MLAIGAIIAFAFNVRVGWLDLDIVGWVLMAAGAVGLILTLTAFNKSRRTVTRTADPYAAPPVRERVVEERATYDDRAL